MPKQRRHLDSYPTPEWATRELLARVRVSGTVLECCAGDGAMVGPLRDSPHVARVLTNDLDPACTAETHEDAALPRLYERLADRLPVDWVVSNPPFSAAPQILKQAHAHARRGVAMLLRLSFLEPCANRAAWLAAHPLSELIVLPRISFTGDGGTDTVTCAWMVWVLGATWQRVRVVERRKHA